MSLQTTVLFVFVITVQSHAFAASEGDDAVDVDSIEAEIGKQPAAPDKPVNGSSSASPENLKDPEKLSDLSRLAPFSEVSVIQRRFLPKTQRFQLNLGLTTIANDPWFWGVGAGGRFGYSFTEAWSVELAFLFLSNTEKDSVKDLRANLGIITNSIISTQGYIGVDAVWSPIYGKMSLFSKRIVPFDMYFAAGLGQTSIANAKSSSATALHLGTGQIYAMSKSVGFRWDLSWNFFSATANPTAANANPSVSTFNNLMLTLGASFFFPEAKYR
ncbi:MAG: outer membrane beta-barrel domain-containing protein [Bdellovibrio sp.]|nr:MAG: outer membrane beta-barrel domain-containing protein [Bdellovibrio sp.]